MLKKENFTWHLDWWPCMSFHLDCYRNFPFVYIRDRDHIVGQCWPPFACQTRKGLSWLPKLVVTASALPRVWILSCELSWPTWTHKWHPRIAQMRQSGLRWRWAWRSSRWCSWGVGGSHIERILHTANVLAPLARNMNRARQFCYLLDRKFVTSHRVNQCHSIPTKKIKEGRIKERKKRRWSC